MSSCDRAPLVTDNSLFPRSAKTSLPIVAAPVNPCNSTRGAARLWLGVHVHARIIMQHIQVWKKKPKKQKKTPLSYSNRQYNISQMALVHMVWQNSSSPSFICSVIKLPDDPNAAAESSVSFFLIRVTKGLLKPKESAHHLQPPQLGTASPVNLTTTAPRCHSYQVFA